MMSDKELGDASSCCWIYIPLSCSLYSADGAVVVVVVGRCSLAVVDVA